MCQASPGISRCMSFDPLLIFFCLFIVLFFISIIIFYKLRTPKVSRPLLESHSLGVQSHFVDLSSGKVHYIEAGNGPTILLLHGLGASLYTWRRLIPLLAEHYHVIAPDIPGFGQSDKSLSLSYDLDSQTQRLEEFIDHLKLTSFDIVGSSMGGLIALWLGLKAPDKVRRIVCLAAALNPRIFPLNPNWFVFLTPWSSRRLNQQWMQRILHRVLAVHDYITPEDVDNYLKPYQNQPEALQICLKAITSIKDRRLPHHLKSLTSQVLLLHGELDKIIPLRVSRSNVKNFKSAQFRLLPGCGHHPQEDDPHAVFKHITEFFSGGKS